MEPLVVPFFFSIFVQTIKMIDKRLKEITIDFRTFYYLKQSDSSEYGTWYWTEFYNTNNIYKMVKKYWLFGPLVKVPNNKQVFQIDYDIECCFKTQDEVRASIRRKVELLNRCEEIKKGEII